MITRVGCSASLVASSSRLEVEVSSAIEVVEGSSGSRVGAGAGSLEGRSVSPAALRLLRSSATSGSSSISKTGDSQ